MICLKVTQNLAGTHTSSIRWNHNLPNLKVLTKNDIIKYKGGTQEARLVTANNAYVGSNPTAMSTLKLNSNNAIIINGVYKALILNNKGTQLDVF